MTADREVLREAVLKAIEGEVTATYQDVPILDPELIADAIADAVLAAEDEHTTIEWAPRYASDGSSAFASTFTEAGARKRVAEASYLALYTRRRGPWKRVD